MMEIYVYIYIFVSIAIHILDYNHTTAAKPWKSKCPVLNIPNAKVRIRARGRMAKISCKSDFAMIEGDRRLTCIKGKWNGRIPQCISSGCTITSVPNGDAIELYDGALLHFHCNPGYSLVGSPAVFCDGATWNASYPECQVPAANPDHLSCSFERTDICGWVQDHVDDLDWKWTTAGHNAFTGGLGAKVDHTYGTPLGHYIFADSKDDWGSGHVARLFSPILANPVLTPACVTFYYHMNGPTTSSLSVYIKPESDPFEMLVPEVSITGFHEDVWNMGYVALPDTDEEYFQVVFEAKGGGIHTSDVAIDDFLVTSGDECIELELQQHKYSTLKMQEKDKKTTPIAFAHTKQEEDSTTEETDHTYIPLSSTSIRTVSESSTLDMDSDDIISTHEESSLKATTPRKIYIPTSKSTLPIVIVLSTPPSVVSIPPLLSRKTLTPIPVTVEVTTLPATEAPLITKLPVTTSTPSPETTKQTTTTLQETKASSLSSPITLPSKNSSSEYGLIKTSTKPYYISSTKSLIDATSQATTTPKNSFILFPTKRTTTSPKSYTKKKLSTSQTNGPTTTPISEHTTSLKTKGTITSSTAGATTISSTIGTTKSSTTGTTTISSTIKTSTSSITHSTTPSTTDTSTSSTVTTSQPKSSLSPNLQHSRPVPGVKALISIVVVGVLVAMVIAGALWLRRLRQQPSLAEDSDVRQLEEEVSEDEHSSEREVERGRRMAFIASYKPLENNSFPQEYDGTPV